MGRWLGAAGAGKLCAGVASLAPAPGRSTSPLDGMLDRHLISALWILFAGFWFVSGALAIRRGVVKFSWRSPASISFQRTQAPIQFWLLVPVDVVAGIVFLWVAWYAV